MSRTIQISESGNDEEADIFKGSNAKNPVLSNVNVEPSNNKYIFWQFN